MKTSKKVLSLLLIAAMLVSVLCMGVSASDYAEVSISEGEPVTISWSGTTGTVVSVDGSSYIPRQFILWVRNGFTVSVDGTALTPNSAPSADDTDVAYTINTDATNAITIVASNGTTTYTITCPHYTATASGTNPVAVNGYLPVGQFARPNSFGWGTLYTDNTNVSSSSNTITVEDTGNAVVFINGEVRTSYTVTTTAKPVQIVVQNGDAEPYIVVLK